MAVSTPNIFYIKDIVYSINEFIKDDNNLLNTNKYLYELKLKYYKLNKEYSLKYYFDNEFKNLIDSKITNSKFQLSLDLSFCDGITDEGIKILGNLHALNLFGCYEITDEGIKYLGNLHTLNLRWCNKITDEGIKHLGNLHTLNLRHCYKITDKGIKMLGNIHTLNLTYCDLITDEGIKNLSNVKNLIR
jgi:hypothetical protein